MKRKSFCVAIAALLFFAGSEVVAQQRPVGARLAAHELKTPGTAGQPVILPNCALVDSAVKKTGATVLFGAVLGTFAAGGVAELTGLSDHSPRAGAALAAAGLGAGAIVGARMGNRVPAYKLTILGASVGAVPLVVNTRRTANVGEDGPEYGLDQIGYFALAVFGAWLGNTLGQ